MKSGFLISSLALFCFCMWTLDLFAAESSSLNSHAGVQSHEALVVSRNGVFIGPTAQGNEFDQRELSALNLLGIRYAKGQGVKRDPRMAKATDSDDYETEDHHCDGSLSGNRVLRSRHPANVLESGMPVPSP